MRDNSDKSDQYTDDEEQKQRSLIRSLFVEVLQSPEKDKLMAELFPKSDDKEYEEISQDAKETVKEQCKYRSSWNSDDHRRSTVQFVSQ